MSFPLLLDREVGAAVAVLTSLRVVAQNPVTMALWGLIVAVLLVVGTLPLFLGLRRRAAGAWPRDVAPLPQGRGRGQSPRADFRPQPPGKRYAAEFPVSLFKRTQE